MPKPSRQQAGKVQDRYNKDGEVHYIPPATQVGSPRECKALRVGVRVRTQNINLR